ncbi:MAG: SGNH/GDSL hydrolase family protein [Bacteroidales bacterium]|nr:SGNH/GDSL hydrolase family protein [Bacteroidales bacterium]
MRKLIITIAAAMLSVIGLSAQNFVHYHWFDGENSTVPAGTRGRVVFMGDSITEGWGTKGTPGFFDNDKMVERGISGEVTAQMVLRFRRDVIDLKPKTVVILCGCNDIALNQGEYNEDYTFGNIVTMVQLAKANKIKPIVCSVLPAAAFPWRPEVKDSSEKVASLNARLREYCAKNRIKYVDYFPAMVAEDGVSLNPNYTNDGIHPTLPGYEVMESIILKAL